MSQSLEKHQLTETPALPLVIQKYGGATLATPEKLKEVARKIKEDAKKYRLIVVVSAMGGTTNELIELAHQVSAHPQKREMDMLLSVGERISMSLMSMALYDLNVPAISLTGSQAGIFTNETHNNAYIFDIKAFRIEEALQSGKVVILAGFQGVSPVTKEITTLGRGGSDITAVAVAAAFSANRCEILKDVSAVFTADPRLVPTARSIPQLTYDEMFDMCFWGAKVLQFRSAEIALMNQINLYIGPSDPAHGSGTLISAESKEAKMKLEGFRVISINSHERVLILEHRGLISKTYKEILSSFDKNQIPYGQVLHWEYNSQNDVGRVYLTGPNEVLAAIQQAIENQILPGLSLDKQEWCAVGVTCQGAHHPESLDFCLENLSRTGLTPRQILFTQSGLGFLVEKNLRVKAIESLHQLIR